MALGTLEDKIAIHARLIKVNGNVGSLAVELGLSIQDALGLLSNHGINPELYKRSSGYLRFYEENDALHDIWGEDLHGIINQLRKLKPELGRSIWYLMSALWAAGKIPIENLVKEQLLGSAADYYDFNDVLKRAPNEAPFEAVRWLRRHRKGILRASKSKEPVTYSYLLSALWTSEDSKVPKKSLDSWTLDYAIHAEYHEKSPFLKHTVRKFTDPLDFAEWFVRNRQKLINSDPNKELPSPVKVAGALGMFGNIPEKRYYYFRREMNCLDYTLNNLVQDKDGTTSNLMRREMERVLDNIDIQLLFVKRRFSYDALRRVTREKINRELFTRRDNGKQVSDGFLDRCIFYASEFWGEELAIRYLLEQNDYSLRAVAKKLGMSISQLYFRANGYGIRFNELKKKRYKVVDEGGKRYILMRREISIPSTYYRPNDLVLATSLSRQEVMHYLHSRAIIPKGGYINISPAAYDNALAHLIAPLPQSFLFLRNNREYQIRVAGERDFVETPHAAKELRDALQLTTSSFAEMMRTVLNTGLNPRNRYHFSDKAFDRIAAAYATK